jgi:hypothetical protein
MNDLPRDVERSSVPRLKKNRGLSTANLSGASSVDLLNILTGERNESDKRLLRTILDEVVRRGACPREPLVEKAPVFRSKPGAPQPKDLR